MGSHLLKMPGTVYSGDNAIENISMILKKENVKKLAVFTDKGIRAAGLLQYPLQEIEKQELTFKIFDELPAEPTYEQAQKLVDQCKLYQADFIVAVGGGSVMDTAKLASVLMTERYRIKELLDTPEKAKKCIKTLMVPTTSGTGSEATPNAIVAVPEKELKVGIVNTEMISDYVILDPIMVKKLPRKIAAATGLDALAHAIECWTSNKANYFSDIFAMEALDLIINNIMTACDNPEAMEAKNKMQIASFYAGIAITASGTTAVHALSYPLGGKYHIPHGVSNAILLAPVMKFNEVACRERLAIVYDRCLKGEASTLEEKSKAVIEKMECFVDRLGIPKDLKEYGVFLGELETLVEAGMSVTRLLDNNIREVTAEDARNIYKKILG